MELDDVMIVDSFWRIIECKDVVVPDECLVVHEIIVFEIMTCHDVKGQECGVMVV